MDKPVNRVRAKPSAAKVAVPSALAPPSRSTRSWVENEDPLDRYTHAKIAQLSGGFSLMGVAEAAFDWALHLAASPGRQALALSALSKQATLLQTSASWSRGGKGGATLPNARGRTTANSPPRNRGGGRFRFMPKAFSRRSDGGTKPRRCLRNRRSPRCSRFGASRAGPMFTMLIKPCRGGAGDCRF